MIRVTVELVPFGNEEEARAIAECIIVNDGTHPELSYYGNYVATVRDLRNRSHEQQVYVENFPRLDLGVWYLLHRVLDLVASEGREGSAYE